MGLNRSIQVRILTPLLNRLGGLPQYATDGSAAMDLRACIEAPIVLGPGETRLIPTGLAIHIQDPRFVGLIAPRSGLGHKHGIVLGNGIGVLDPDYQGEVKISAWNRNLRHGADSRMVYTIQPGERIAQLLFMPIERVSLLCVDAFTDSARGEGGFGHTGTA